MPKQFEVAFVKSTCYSIILSPLNKLKRKKKEKNFTADVNSLIHGVITFWL